MPGRSHNHFRGKTGSHGKRRAKGTSRKQRRLKQSPHVNRYAEDR